MSNIWYGCIPLSQITHMQKKNFLLFCLYTPSKHFFFFSLTSCPTSAVRVILGSNNVFLCYLHRGSSRCLLFCNEAGWLRSYLPLLKLECPCFCRKSYKPCCPTQVRRKYVNARCIVCRLSRHLNYRLTSMRELQTGQAAPSSLCFSIRSHIAGLALKFLQSCCCFQEHLHSNPQANKYWDVFAQ